ncbi:lipoprotein signal peptidase [Candidatus Azobacteroides pseudotrichonymphae]|uniref:Lipoprotein signal peptidase n=1 Tax=Azobacteroides pseudotrichonymphae genomovar. CFP2 TaxID=511995 RepID=B6YQN8_AZOPC|nr:lipoprotein signal peptidase [Candidatus Azobacteroides pseudotrichonymphae]BAG83510.1 signal peptidase II [Candidatus Azobacteroides pseudotrichonymphae genomovar. CFP2]
MKMSKGFWAIVLITFILLEDQAIKIWIKTHVPLYKDIYITHWFHICFIENNGMAMGIEITAKLFLSIFRIIVSTGIACYLYGLVKRNFELGYILCISMIFAGAIGNIIDSIFYGVIFSNSTSQIVSTLFPFKGYATWLHGKVVDMFYMPFFKFSLPTWIPFVGGDEFIFFRYIFNLADVSVCTGIAILLCFYRNTFYTSFEKNLS